MKKTRTIVASILMFLIVLLLIIIVVAVATRKPSTSRTQNEESSSQIAQNGKNDQTVENDAKEENLEPVSNSDESATIQSTPDKEEPKTEEEVKTIEIDVKGDKLPQSGPESALPIALLLGAVVMFATSCVCAKEKRVL